MDTIKIRLTVDLEIKATDAIQDYVVSNHDFAELAKSKCPNATMRDHYIGVLGEVFAHIVRDAVKYRIPPSSYGEDLRVLSVAYNELITLPPPATATPLVVNVGDRNKP